MWYVLSLETGDLSFWQVKFSFFTKINFLAIFAFILIYLFSIVGFLFFQDQCEVEIDLSNGESVVENHCETLLMSIITTFNEGLRNGGGIGDFLRHLSKDHDQVSKGAIIG